MCRATFPTVHLWLTVSPKHTDMPSYPYEDTALSFIGRLCSFCSNLESFLPNPLLNKITIYNCNKDCRTVLTGTSYPNKSHVLFWVVVFVCIFKQSH